MARDPMDRFWEKVLITEDCWEWQGQSLPHGYGQFRVGTRATDPKEYTHRLAWSWANGPIPAGHNVLHRCDNPRCVRPAHLFLGTQADNVADMDAKGRRRSNNSEKTHCRSGHPYDEANTYRRKGERRCRTCARETMRRLRARKAG